MGIMIPNATLRRRRDPTTRGRDGNVEYGAGHVVGGHLNQGLGANGYYNVTLRDAAGTNHPNFALNKGHFLTFVMRHPLGCSIRELWDTVADKCIQLYDYGFVAINDIYTWPIRF